MENDSKELDGETRIVDTGSYRCYLKQCCNCHYWSGIRSGTDNGWLKAHCDKHMHLSYRDESCNEFVPNIGQNVY